MGMNEGSYHMFLQGHCAEQCLPSVTIGGDVGANKIENIKFFFIIDDNIDAVQIYRSLPNSKLG